MPKPVRPFWFIPSHGDGRWLGDPEGSRSTEFGYLAQVAQAADRLGFEGALLPTGRTCEDSWVLAGALAPLTRWLKFLVAVRPGVTSPLFAARQAATLDRVSEGRLLVNVVPGGDQAEMRADGVVLDHGNRYAQTREFLEVWKRLMAGERVDYQGDHIFAEGAELLFPPVQQNGPPLYIGGSSDAAMAITADHIDWFLSWGEPPAQLREKISRMQELAARAGRQVRFGIRMHIIVRETEEAAWAEADRLISRLDDADIARAQATQAKTESVGQRRMQALHRGNREKLVIAPNLWAGVGLIRGGAGTALVGAPDTLAARIAEYADMGIETFILSGYPHLEEVYRTAELLLPHLEIAPVGRPDRVIPPGRAGEAGGFTLNRNGGMATGPS